MSTTFWVTRKFKNQLILSMINDFFMKFFFRKYLKNIGYLGFRLKCMVSEILETWITLD